MAGTDGRLKAADEFAHQCHAADCKDGPGVDGAIHNG
jgi:hypothetical protein